MPRSWTSVAHSIATVLDECSAFYCHCDQMTNIVNLDGMLWNSLAVSLKKKPGGSMIPKLVSASPLTQPSILSFLSAILRVCARLLPPLPGALNINFQAYSQFTQLSSPCLLDACQFLSTLLLVWPPIASPLLSPLHISNKMSQTFGFCDWS